MHVQKEATEYEVKDVGIDLYWSVWDEHLRRRESLCITFFSTFVFVANRILIRCVHMMLRSIFSVNILQVLLWCRSEARTELSIRYNYNVFQGTSAKHCYVVPFSTCRAHIESHDSLFSIGGNGRHGNFACPVTNLNALQKFIFTYQYILFILIWLICTTVFVAIIQRNRYIFTRAIS